MIKVEYFKACEEQQNFGEQEQKKVRGYQIKRGGQLHQTKEERFCNSLWERFATPSK